MFLRDTEGDATEVTIGTTVCSITECTDTKIVCEIGVMSADNYDIKIARPYGLAHMPAEYSVFEALFTASIILSIFLNTVN